jgi:arsenite methyltransferase
MNQRRLLRQAGRKVAGLVLLDPIASRDGLIASAAAAIVGPQGHVICSDISQDVLDLCRECATESAVVDRCSFLKAPASDLSPIEDETVDAVTVRSVLIYEPNKAAAFAEFHRVLRPHGRLSLFEPINNYGRGETPNQLLGFDITPVAGIAEQLSPLYTVAAAAPMSDFNERDLVRFAEAAGFTEIHLQLNVAVRYPDPIPWQTFINIAPNPLMPPSRPTIRRHPGRICTNQIWRVTSKISIFVCVRAIFRCRGWSMSVRGQSFPDEMMR